MHHRKIRIIILCLMSILLYDCKKNKIAISEEVKEVVPLKIEDKNYLDAYLKYMPTDTLIKLNYSIYSEKCGYVKDLYAKKNKKYMEIYEGYDKEGNLVEYIFYSSDGQIAQQDISFYENGLLKHLYRFSNNFHDNLNKYSYFYDQNKRLTFSTMASFEKRLTKEALNSNSDCFTQDDLEKFKTWDDFKVTEYKYDSKGNKIEEKTYGANYWVQKEVYNYYKNGKMLEQISYENGNLQRTISKQYFQNETVTTCKFNSYNSGNITTQKFDNDNNILSEICVNTATKQRWFSRLYYYDDQKRCIKEDYINENGDTSSTTYQYKTHNKPIKKRITVKKWDTNK